MILNCDCGRLKTVQPYRCNSPGKWLCEVCSPAKQSRANARAAQEAGGGRSYPSQRREPAGA